MYSGCAQRSEPACMSWTTVLFFSRRETALYCTHLRLALSDSSRCALSHTACSLHSQAAASKPQQLARLKESVVRYRFYLLKVCIASSAAKKHCFSPALCVRTRKVDARDSQRLISPRGAQRSQRPFWA